jgi:hypothetical protein
MVRNIIGLFGSCGDTTWRKDIAIPIIKKAKKKYFNPQKKTWTKQNAILEYDHLMNDKVIVHVITDETNGFGSLSESGWIAMGALLRGQKIGFYIEEDNSKLLNSEEKRARELIKYHIENIKHPDIFLAKNISELINWAIREV